MLPTAAAVMASQTDVDDRSWIHEALEQFERPLLGYARRITGCQSQAEDVVQETFLRLCQQSPADLDGHLAEWLFAVCRNRAIDVKRKEQRMSSAVSPEFLTSATETPPPGFAAEQADETDRILSALSRLPASQQEVVRLKFQGELSYREISRITGRSVSNVGYLIHQALSTLRQRLPTPEE